MSSLPTLYVTQSMLKEEERKIGPARLSRWRRREGGNTTHSRGAVPTMLKGMWKHSANSMWIFPKPQRLAPRASLPSNEDYCRITEEERGVMVLWLLGADDGVSSAWVTILLSLSCTTSGPWRNTWHPLSVFTCFSHWPQLVTWLLGSLSGLPSTLQPLWCFLSNSDKTLSIVQKAGREYYWIPRGSRLSISHFSEWEIAKRTSGLIYI